MFATYDHDGISFAYPENWVLDEGADDEARLNLTVSSPNTAFWTLIVYGELLDTAAVVEQTIEALKTEYPQLETDPVTEEIAGEQLIGQDVTFFYLDLTSTAQIRAVQRGQSTYLILCQSEDRELETVDPVFRAITQSLLSEEPLPSETEEA